LMLTTDGHKSIARPLCNSRATCLGPAMMIMMMTTMTTTTRFCIVVSCLSANVVYSEFVIVSVDLPISFAISPASIPKSKATDT